MGLTFSQILRQAGNTGDVGVTADGVNVDAQETVMVKTDPNLLKLHFHTNISTYLLIFFTLRYI